MNKFRTPMDMESQLIEHTELAAEEILAQLELGYSPGRLMVIHLVWISRHNSLIEWIEKNLDYSGWTTLRLNNPSGDTYALAVFENSLKRLSIKRQYFRDTELRPDLLEVLSQTGWCIEDNNQESDVYFHRKQIDNQPKDQNLDRLFSAWKTNHK